MKLTKQSYEILEQEIPVRKPDDTNSSYKDRYLTAMYKHIEKCGRTCYKSEDKITENSAEKFVNGLIKSKHLSVLEHGVIYLKIPYGTIDEVATMLSSSGSVCKTYKYYGNNYTEIHPNPTISCDCITTNYRVIIENGWEDDLQYLCEPTEYHTKRHTVLLHTCIHVYKDLTRHRKMSFSIESTRYCNYSKGKFGGQLKFVIPSWTELYPWDEIEAKANYNKVVDENIQYGDISAHMAAWSECDYDGYVDHFDFADRLFLDSLKESEDNYLELIDEGWQPQQAAEVLPQCTAADVVMSGFDKDWEFVFRLRSDIAETGKPHPLVEELMTPLRNEFEKKIWKY